MQMPALQDLNQDEINHNLNLIRDATGQDNDKEEEEMVSDEIAETVAKSTDNNKKKKRKVLAGVSAPRNTRRNTKTGEGEVRAV